MKKLIAYFTIFELILWITSVLTIFIVFYMFQNNEHLYLIASLIGVTALIFLAKGNPIGQFLIIVFSIFYGFISFSYQYYGEMITYLGMTAPIALVALISWLKHPFSGQLKEVEINTLSRRSHLKIILSGLLVTLCFYFILNFLSTPNIILSSFSVFTSYVASLLTLKRSKFYALAYAINDLVLISLWLLASIHQITYISLVICFLAFFVNDLYGFVSWTKLHNKQKQFA
ncbi:MAG: nicotinamide riboside transporter PnuC [Acholeplasmataceae bacterium]